IVATCTPNGANDVKQAYLDPLSGKPTVWVSGDNDDSGQRYRKKCVALLTGRVSELRELQVPTGYKDWAEWAEGREETQDAFLDLLEDAPVICSSSQVESKPGKTITLGRKSPAADVAEAFLDARGYDTSGNLLLRCNRDEWHRYNGRIFVPVPKGELMAE